MNNSNNYWFILVHIGSNEPKLAIGLYRFKYRNSLRVSILSEPINLTFRKLFRGLKYGR